MIHQYRLGGYNIVIDVCSGAIHVVDEVAYDIISLFESNSKEDILSKIAEKYADRADISADDISECYNQVCSLKEQGKLFAPDTFASMAGKLKEKTAGVVKALCLHVAHTCNLNCAYCFASQGKYHGDVVKQLVAYAREIEKEHNKNFRFTLTTNGLLIDDDVIEFANKEMSNVVLSLDGRKEIHDRYRVDYSGNGSWDRIVPKFQQLVEAREGKNYYMRGTFTHRNPDFLNDIKQMLDLGFNELSMEPVVCAPGEPAELTEEDLPIVLDQYEKLAELMLEKNKEGKPFTFYHYMIDLTGGPCIYKRISGCGSGTEYMAVTPWGDLYPCHQFVGDEKFRLGDVWTGVTNTEIQGEFAACNVYAHEECKDCWARLYCSGGCAANAYHSTGSVTGVYEYGCKLFKKRMECAIMVEIAKALGTE